MLANQVPSSTKRIKKINSLIKMKQKLSIASEKETM